MGESLKKGKNTTLENIDTFIDGAAVVKVGELCFKIAKRVIDKMYSVPENRVCVSILEFLKEDGIVLEPAGAMSVDCLNEIKDKIEGKNVVCILSGGNFDFNRLAEVQERSLRSLGVKKYYITHFPQRPGALKEFIALFGRDDDIVRFEYIKKTNKETGPAVVGIETSAPNNFAILEKKWKKARFVFEDITNNERYFDILI